MKANGKNLLMFSYMTHDYMDELPEQSFRTAESHEVMDAFMEHMATHWSGGTCYGKHECTPEEYFQLRNSRYWKGLEFLLDDLAEDCTEEWVATYSKLLENNK